MSSSFCKSLTERRTAVLNFEKIFFLNNLKNTARWFLFEVKLNIRLLSLSTWRTRLLSEVNVKLPFQFNWMTELFFLSKQRTEFLPVSELNTELLLMSELNIKLPFWFNKITELFFSDEQRSEFLSASRLSTELLLESRLNSD